MRVLLSTYGSRRNVGPRVGLAVRLCAPPDFAELPACVDAVIEGCDVSVATGATPTEGW